MPAAALAQYKKPATHVGGFLVAGVGFEPTTFGLCVPTTAFAASSTDEFGVWTFSSPVHLRQGYGGFGCLPLSLYTFPYEAPIRSDVGLGSGLPFYRLPRI